MVPVLVVVVINLPPGPSGGAYGSVAVVPYIGDVDLGTTNRGVATTFRPSISAQAADTAPAEQPAVAASTAGAAGCIALLADCVATLTTCAAPASQYSAIAAGAACLAEGGFSTCRGDDVVGSDVPACTAVADQPCVTALAAVLASAAVAKQETAVATVA